MIHTVKGFGIVNKAEIDVFLELSCWYYPWPKPILLKGDEKDYLKGEVGQAKRGTGARMLGCVFQTEILCDHLSGLSLWLSG